MQNIAIAPEELRRGCSWASKDDEKPTNWRILKKMVSWEAGLHQCASSLRRLWGDQQACVGFSPGQWRFSCLEDPPTCKTNSFELLLLNFSLPAHETWHEEKARPRCQLPFRWWRSWTLHGLGMVLAQSPTLRACVTLFSEIIRGV